MSDSIKRAQEIWSRPSGAARSHIKPYGKNKDPSHWWEAHNSPVPPEPVRNLTSATIRRWFWTQGTYSWPKCNFSSRTTKKRKPLWIKLDAQKEERQKLPSPNAKSQEIGNLNQWQYCSPSLWPRVLLVTNCSIGVKMKARTNVTWSKLSTLFPFFQSISQLFPLYKIPPCHLSLASNLFLLTWGHPLERRISAGTILFLSPRSHWGLNFDFSLIILQMAKRTSLGRHVLYKRTRTRNSV